MNASSDDKLRVSQSIPFLFLPKHAHAHGKSRQRRKFAAEEAKLNTEEENLMDSIFSDNTQSRTPGSL